MGSKAAEFRKRPSEELEAERVYHRRQTDSLREALGAAETELARLSPDPAAARQWATLQQELSARAGHALAVNLDPATLILDMVLKMNETAADILSRR